jgi:hypothetical protein
VAFYLKSLRIWLYVMRVQNITFCFRQATHAVIFLVMSGGLGSPKVSRRVSTPNGNEGSLSDDVILIVCVEFTRDIETWKLCQNLQLRVTTHPSLIPSQLGE